MVCSYQGERKMMVRSSIGSSRAAGEFAKQGLESMFGVWSDRGGSAARQGKAVSGTEAVIVNSGRED